MGNGGAARHQLLIWLYRLFQMMLREDCLMSIK